MRKTEIEGRCPIHNTPRSLDSCRAFKFMSFNERRKLLSDKKLCFKCFSDKHIARDCKCEIKCSVCSSRYHCTAMHIDTAHNMVARNSKRLKVGRNQKHTVLIVARKTKKRHKL